ncbi:hypothetical protein N7520_004263 [Penicillium odoratum]|uniref:uncharacterized protein n=1 Tax=Penicillium odoratum TaxID=1167516 RepID=UPI002547F902|nr:uncharacterized protein N7520_004263 [Penicillium odoratum]KAJ5769704.1 hypothetical protein N7520_004263 [Penicillium odoratum]
MRLEYTPLEPYFEKYEEKQILDRVLQRRGGALIPLDRTLLYAPLITDGFNSFMIALRTKNSLPPDVREIVFCRVTALTLCWYEWNIHAPIALSTGVSQEGLEDVRNLHLTGAKGLNDCQLSVVKYTDAITTAGKVPDAVFELTRAFFSEKEMVELTASIAGFNTVARFCVALEVGE